MGKHFVNDSVIVGALATLLLRGEVNITGYKIAKFLGVPSNCIYSQFRKHTNFIDREVL